MPDGDLKIDYVKGEIVAVSVGAGLDKTYRQCARLGGGGRIAEYPQGETSGFDSRASGAEWRARKERGPRTIQRALPV